MNDRANHIALITDSTCDIPPLLMEQYNIIRAPQYLIWGTEQLRDQIDISTEAFYERLLNDPIHPKTAKPSAADFAAHIEEAKANGAEEAVIITLSSQMAGVIDSARQAQDMVDIPIHAVDSLSVSMGLGWQVLAAARAREAGGDAEAMVAAANKVRETLAVIFSVDTLEYLHKGGRIGGAAKLVGTALDLKPQLYVDHTTGRIEPGERTRTRKKALERVYHAFFEQMDTSKPMHVTVLHIAAEEEAKTFSERIKGEYNPGELLFSLTSPIVGTHGGPGTLGIAGYYEA